MTEFLKRVFDKADRLSPEEQDALAGMFDGLIEAKSWGGLFKVVNSPFVAGLILLLIGTVWYGDHAHRRDIREARRQKAVQAVEQTAKAINTCISHTYQAIRDAKHDTSKSQEKLGALFSDRFEVHLEGRYFVEDDGFSKAYTDLIFELEWINDLLDALNEKRIEAEAALSLVKRVKSELSRRWGMAPDSFYDRGKIGDPYDEMVTLCNMLYSRSYRVIFDFMSEAWDGSPSGKYLPLQTTRRDLMTGIPVETPADAGN